MSITALHRAPWLRVAALLCALVTTPAGADESWRMSGDAVGRLAGNLPPSIGGIIMPEVVRVADGTPKGSHFYTPSVDECATVQANASWQYEGVVFAMTLPDGRGVGPAATIPLYRLYSNG